MPYRHKAAPDVTRLAKNAMAYTHHHPVVLSGTKRARNACLDRMAGFLEGARQHDTLDFGNQFLECAAIRIQNLMQ